MLERIDRRNRGVWQGHPAGFRDAAELLGGLGLGFLAFGLLRPAVRPYGLILTGIALALYTYAASSRRQPQATEPDDFTLQAGDVTMF